MHSKHTIMATAPEIIHAFSLVQGQALIHVLKIMHMQICLFSSLSDDSRKLICRSLIIHVRKRYA